MFYFPIYRGRRRTHREWLLVPNREIKPAEADGTWGETPWESRKSPRLFEKAASARSGFLVAGMAREAAFQSKGSTGGCNETF